MRYNPEENEYVWNDTEPNLAAATPGHFYSVQLKADHLFHRNASSNITVLKNRKFLDIQYAQPKMYSIGNKLLAQNLYVELVFHQYSRLEHEINI